MMRKPPKYCQGFLDRHGKIRWYFRRPNFKRVALPGLPWTPTFMAAYEAAMTGVVSIGESRSKPGTIAALVESYYRSSEYLNLKPITQRTYRSTIDLSANSTATKPCRVLSVSTSKPLFPNWQTDPPLQTIG